MNKRINPELRKYKRNLLFVFSLIIVLFLILGLIKKDVSFSENENRNLKQFPSATSSNIKSGKFGSELESYMQDQFIMRDSFVSLKTWFEKLILKQEINGVYINNKDFLISKFDKNQDSLIKEKADAINKFVKAHPSVKSSILLSPNKVEVYNDKLPSRNTEKSQSKFIEDFYNITDGSIKKVDITTALKQNKNEYLFFNTDHHWTQRGAFSAYQVLEKEVFKNPIDSNYDIKTIANDFYGTLSSKTGIKSKADNIEVYVPKNEYDYVINIPSEKRKTSSFYDTSKLKEKDKYLTFLGGNYPVVRITSESIVDKRLLVIKDSYANSLIPFLIKDFNEITVVDLRYYTGNIHQLVKDYNISNVLFLYNVNTFNDDNSILNVGDYIDSKGNPIINKEVETPKVIKPKTEEEKKETNNKKDSKTTTTPSTKP